MEEFTINEKLKDLGRNINEALSDKTNNQGALWKDIWNEIRAISKVFREVKFSTPNARQEFWYKFQEMIEKVKEEQDRYFKKRSERDQVSQELLNEIISQTKAAWPHEDGFMEFIAVISGAKVIADLVTVGLEAVVNAATFGWLKTDKNDSKKDELDTYSLQMKKAWELYKEYKDRLIKPHRDVARQTLVGTQGELDKEWSLWKLEQNKNWEKRRSQFEANETAKEELISEMRRLVGCHRDADARTRVKEIFNEWRAIKSAGRDKDEDLWNEFKSLHDEFWEQNKISYEQSKVSFRERAENEIEKLERMLEKAKYNLEANQERLDTSRSEEFEEQVREWIKNDESYIEKLETWIDEWRDKLQEL